MSVKRFCDICGSEGAKRYTHYLHVDIDKALDTKYDFCATCKGIIESVLWKVERQCGDLIIAQCQSPMEALVRLGVTKERFHEAKQNEQEGQKESNESEG